MTVLGRNLERYRFAMTICETNNMAEVRNRPTAAPLVIRPHQEAEDKAEPHCSPCALIAQEGLSCAAVRDLFPLQTHLFLASSRLREYSLRGYNVNFQDFDVAS